MYPKMLFDKGDPREAYALAEDAEQDQALRARGYAPLDESGLHPDQFRVVVGAEVAVSDHGPLPGLEGLEPSPEVKPGAVMVKRGPGRPRKE